MSMQTIGARVLFTTAGAVVSARRFSFQIRQTERAVLDIKKASAESGQSFNQFMKVMKEQRATSATQRNVRLATQTISTFTRTVTEARKVTQGLFHVLNMPLKAGAGILGLGGAGASGVSRFSRRAAGAAGSVSGGGPRSMFKDVLIGLSDDALLAGSDAAAGGLNSGKGLLSTWVTLAATMEGARVTFDAMLGSQSQSELLMKKITGYASATPFSRGDIIEGSKTLLSITGKNLAMNERLFRMSGNIAALKPGTKVAAISQGIVQASVGNFEILKGMGIVLRAKQFEGVGEAGGKTYVAAVLKEIEKQFKAKTGGADLVGALSETLIGKVSTLNDNLDIIGTMLGERITNIFGLKEQVTVAIKWLDQLARALEHFFNPAKDPEGALLEGVDARIIDIAKDVIWFFDKIDETRKAVMPRLKQAVLDIGEKLLEWRVYLVGVMVAFEGVGTVISAMLGPLMAAVLLVLGPLGLAISTVAAVAAMGIPVIVTLGTGLALILSGMILPATFAMAFMTSVVWSMILGFLAFKEEGESSWTAIIRLLMIGKNVMKATWGVVTQLATGFIGAFGPDVIVAFNKVNAAVMRIAHAVGAILTPILKALGVDSVETWRHWITLGKFLGHLLGGFVLLAVNLLTLAMTGFANVLEIVGASVAPVVSDLYRIGKAMKDLITGQGSNMYNLKTIMLGVGDILTAPFRHFIADVLDLLKKDMEVLEEWVRPYSATIGDSIAGAATMFSNASDVLHEGLLKTDRLFKNNLNVSLEGILTTVQPIEVKIDGQKVAEATVTNEVRARNSGRGGDPVTPDELGFVIEGGSSIRPVLMNEVAKEF